MKKTYIIPEINIVHLDFTQQILSGSITLNSAGDAVDAGNAAGREYDYDFEEGF